MSSPKEKGFKKKSNNPINSLVEKINSLVFPKKDTPSKNKESLKSDHDYDPNKESIADTLYKKIPPGKKLTPQVMFYGAFGLLLLLGVMASASTKGQKPQDTPIPSGTPLPTLPPNISQETPLSQKTFISTIHEFSFTHPGLSDQCCYINGPHMGDNQNIGNLSDPSTTRQGSGEPFDGLSLYIIELGNTTSDEYIKKEASALIKEYVREYEEEPKNKSFQNITIADQPTVLLQNYSSLTVNRYYIQFPKENKILYIGASEQKLHSFNATLGKILKSLKFE